MTTKTKKRGKKFGSYADEFPTITGPAVVYEEYRPLSDPRMRLAMERAAREQPPMISLASHVPDAPLWKR